MSEEQLFLYSIICTFAQPVLPGFLFFLISHFFTSLYFYQNFFFFFFFNLKNNFFEPEVVLLMLYLKYLLPCMVKSREANCSPDLGYRFQQTQIESLEA